MSTGPIKPIFGTEGKDTINGTHAGEVISGRGDDDTINSKNGGDIAYGGSGDDTIYGNAGSDILYGGGGPKYGDLGRFVVTEDYEATVTFLNEGAGFKNTLGVYDIDPTTREIVNVKILFANASKQGSGGDLIGGESATYLPIEAGEELGFFVISNGYGKWQNRSMLDDEDATWKMVDADGNPATDQTKDPKLVYVDSETGEETAILSQYGNSMFHSTTSPGEVSAANKDGLAHTVGKVNTVTGTVLLGFEDLMNGGDKDFDDVVFNLDIGVTNAVAWIDGNSGQDDGDDNDGEDGPVASENDHLYGGSGADELYGMAGNDFLYGGDGHDLIYGNSGEDHLEGGTGNDTMRGGQGNDTLRGGSGDDIMKGDSGDDIFYMETGGDTMNGGSGSDTLDASELNRSVKIDIHKKIAHGAGTDTITSIENAIGTDHDDWIRGDKRDNILVGGDGDDTIRGQEGDDSLTGGNGADSFVYLTKDVVRFGSVDTITDFDITEDTLNLRKLLDGASDETVQNYVSATVSGDDLLISCDLDGADGDFEDVCVLEGLGAFTLDSLMDNDALILA